MTQLIGPVRIIRPGMPDLYEMRLGSAVILQLASMPSPDDIAQALHRHRNGSVDQSSLWRYTGDYAAKMLRPGRPTNAEKAAREASDYEPEDGDD
jgi:hypothetical protein